jgi:hypothetical protein
VSLIEPGSTFRKSVQICKTIMPLSSMIVLSHYKKWDILSLQSLSKALNFEHLSTQILFLTSNKVITKEQLHGAESFYTSKPLLT